jgi:hypothetical protein
MTVTETGVRDDNWIYWILTGRMGHAVAQLVEALCYKPEGPGVESR